MLNSSMDVVSGGVYVAGLTFGDMDGPNSGNFDVFFAMLAPPTLGKLFCGKEAGNHNVVKGTDHGEKIMGTAGNDLLLSFGGDDEILGLDGDDCILAGSGNDRISGGRNNDQLLGDSGDDILLGGSGYDRILGGNGNDFLNGDNGSDKLDGGGGFDKCVSQPADTAKLECEKKRHLFFILIPVGVVLIALYTRKNSRWPQNRP